MPTKAQLQERLDDALAMVSALREAMHRAREYSDDQCHQFDVSREQWTTDEIRRLREALIWAQHEMAAAKREAAELRKDAESYRRYLAEKYPDDDPEPSNG